MGLVAAAAYGVTAIAADLSITLAPAIATAIGGALVGAGGGALLGAVTGGNVGEDALLGGLTGGAVAGLGPTIGDALGISATGGDILAGAGAGALGQGVTGGNPLLGAAEGGVAGGVSGLVSGASAGGGVSASSLAPDFLLSGDVLNPAGEVLNPDLTSAVPLSAADTLSTTPVGLADTTAGFAAPITDTGGGFATPAAAGDTSFIGGAQAPDTGTGSLPTLQMNPGTGDLGSAATGSNAFGPTGSAAPVGTFAATYPGATNPPTLTNALEGAGSVTTPGTSIGTGGGFSLSSLFGGGSQGGILGSGISTGQALGAALAGGGLIYDLSQKNSIPGQAALTSEASTLSTEAQQLQNYVTTGTLPPGVSTVLTQVQQGLVNQIKAKYASLGMSGSTAEQQDINNAALQVQSQGATEALNLMNQGVSLAQLAGQLQTTLLNTNVQQNQQTATSIGQLAAALAGGGGATIKLAPAAG